MKSTWPEVGVKFKEKPLKKERTLQCVEQIHSQESVCGGCWSSFASHIQWGIFPAPRCPVKLPSEERPGERGGLETAGQSWSFLKRSLKSRALLRDFLAIHLQSEGLKMLIYFVRLRSFHIAASSRVSRDEKSSAWSSKYEGVCGDAFT